jgi:hypothetical protein
MLFYVVSTEILGQKVGIPFFACPTAGNRMFHTQVTFIHYWRHVISTCSEQLISATLSISLADFYRLQLQRVIISKAGNTESIMPLTPFPEKF